MGVNTKANGRMGKLAAKDVSGMPMATPMRASGSKTKQTDTDNTYSLTVQNTSVIGKMMFSTAEDKRHGLMARRLRATMWRAKSMDREPTSGLMALNLVGDGPTTRLMAMAFTCGQMVENSKEIGKTTTCMARESTPGLMVDAMKATMRMIRSMDKAYTPGATVDNTVVSG